MPAINFEKYLIQPGYALVVEEKDAKSKDFVVDRSKSEFKVGEVVGTAAADMGCEHDVLVPKMGDRILYRTYGNDDVELNGEAYHLIPFAQIAMLYV